MYARCVESPILLGAEGLGYSRNSLEKLMVLDLEDRSVGRQVPEC
jgi:hypothetical protein